MGWGMLAGLGNAAKTVGTDIQTLANTQKTDALAKEKEAAALLMQERVYERSKSDAATLHAQSREELLSDRKTQYEREDKKEEKRIAAEKNSPTYKLAQMKLEEANLEAKIPAAVKLQLKSLDDRAAVLQKSLADAMGRDTYSQDSVGVQKLNAQLIDIIKLRSDAITPYLPAAKTAAPKEAHPFSDPAPTAAAAAPAATPAPSATTPLNAGVAQQPKKNAPYSDQEVRAAKYGAFTPDYILKRGVELGVPAAVAYMNKARADDSGYGVGA